MIWRKDYESTENHTQRRGACRTEHRNALHGGLRRKNRTLAYLVSMLLFSLYHVWGYAMIDPTNWVYLLQYLPVSWLLCRCYERCNSIWGRIFFHMSVNAVSISALNALSELLG